jgi:hypothetical protein
MIIANGKLDLIARDLGWVTHQRVGPILNLPLASDIARLLQHVSPVILQELVRGYRLASDAGLLGEKDT